MTVTSTAGTTSGNTKLSISPGKLNASNTYSYKTAASVDLPKLQSTVTGYTTWDGSAEISATSNNEIVVVELDTNSKVVRVGKTKVTAAS